MARIEGVLILDNGEKYNFTSTEDETEFTDDMTDEKADELFGIGSYIMGF